MITYRKLALLSLLAVPCALSGQITLYQEEFTGSGEDGPMTQINWVGHITRSDMVTEGTVIPSEGGGSWENAYILAAPHFMLYVTTSYPQLLAWTEEFSFNLDNYESVTFSWESRHNNAVASMQPMVRVDGAWYVTATSATHAAGSSTWQLNEWEVTGNASD